MTASNMSEANEQYVESTPNQSGVKTTDDGVVHINATEMLASDEARQNQEWFWSEGVKGEGEKPDWYNPDKFPSVADQAKAADGLRKALSQKGGEKANVPEEYSLNLSEDLTDKIDVSNEDPLLGWFSETAKNIGMSQEQFDSVVNDFYKQTLTMSESQQAEFEKQKEAEQQAYIESEFEKLGPNAKQRVENLNEWLKSSFDESTYNVFKDFTSSAQAVEALEKIRAKANSTPIPGRKVEGAQSYSHNEAQKMLQDPRFGREAAFTQQVEAYYRKLNDNT